MGWALALLAFALLTAVQTTLAGHMAIAGIVPNLPLVLVMVLGLRSGPSRGALAGVAAGFFTDLVQGSHLGLFALAMGMAGWVCGEAGVRVDPGRGAVRWVIAAVAATCYGLVVVGLWAATGHAVDLRGVLRPVFGAAIYDALVASLAYWPVAAAERRAGPSGHRSS